MAVAWPPPRFVAAFAAAELGVASAVAVASSLVLQKISKTCMSLTAAQLRDLSGAIADRIYIQIAGWHLYLGDAKLAQPLAEELAGFLNQGAAAAVRSALERLQVPVGGGSSRFPLARLIPPGQLTDLEEILEPFCSDTGKTPLATDACN